MANNGFSVLGSLSSSSSGVQSAGSSAGNFPFAADRKTVDLCEGYVAVPVWEIRKKKQVYNEEEKNRANLLSMTWTPKGSLIQAPQRCPSIWVDNINFLWTPEMPEPQVLLGHWNKEVELYGKKQKLEGLAIAGGGHFERCANKTGTFVQPRAYDGKYENVCLKLEAGDMSLRSAADKELKEEIGIDANKIRATMPLGYMDDVFSDPRCHGVRFIYLRWVEQANTSKELPNIIAVPLSMLGQLCEREVTWKSPQGNELGLILNHDLLLKIVMSHPMTREFLTNMRLYAEQEQRVLPVGGFGQLWK